MDEPRYTVADFEQKISGLEKMLDRADAKIARRNWVIGATFSAVILCALVGAWMAYTNVLTVDFSKDNLAIQLANAKTELDEAKTKLNEAGDKAKAGLNEMKLKLEALSKMELEKEKVSLQSGIELVSIMRKAFGYLFLIGVMGTIASGIFWVVMKMRRMIDRPVATTVATLLIALISPLFYAVCGLGVVRREAEIAYIDKKLSVYEISDPIVPRTTEVNPEETPAPAAKSRVEY